MLMLSVAQSSRYKGAQVMQGVNPTTLYVGDVIQIFGDELGFIQNSSRRLARQINSVYDQMVANGCACPKIQVSAHSQGTMVFRRAYPLIKKDALAAIYFTGIGGQTTMQGDYGLGGQESYASYTDLVRRDWVPVVGF